MVMVVCTPSMCFSTVKVFVSLWMEDMGVEKVKGNKLPVPAHLAVRQAEGSET